MDNVIETSRLRLRPFATDDARFAFEWFGDPSVMRFTPSGTDKDLGQTVERIAGYRKHQSAYGYSKWMIVDRISHQPIGDAGLMYLPEYGWIDFGYRLAQPFWGKGLATEAASAWLDKAFGELQLDRLVAIAHPENSASLNVLQKLGFSEQRRGTVMGMDCVILHITPAAVRKNNSSRI
jgi:[ribosomal protein S5]-alanine N-acetyltransferase